MLITFFGGFILSGINSWRGLCLACGEWQRSHSSSKTFHERRQYASDLLSRYPDQHEVWEEYDGLEFSFVAGDLRPARKRRLVVTRLYDPVALETLLDELTFGKQRVGEPPIEGLSQPELQRKFSGRVV